MKQMIYWLLALTLLVNISCEGYTEEELGVANLVLQPDKTQVKVGETVEFTVAFSGESVTEKAEISCLTNGKVLDTSSFTATQVGDFTFQASYEGVKSSKVTITVQADEPSGNTSRFVRQVCVMDLTGTWCSMCPDGFVFLNTIVNMSTYKDVVHVMGMHSKGGDSDPFHLDVTDEINNELGNGPLGFPAFVVDLRVKGSLNGERPLFRTSLDESLNKYLPHCGVAVKSQLDNSQAKITVRLQSEKTAEYRLAIYVVEDNIRSKQNKGGKYVDNYLHRHVTRRLLSASYKGDKLGTIEAGKEVARTNQSLGIYLRD
ncbi:MAG: Omp28-related outer membrane protein [Phocaeicola coprocola]